MVAAALIVLPGAAQAVPFLSKIAQCTGVATVDQGQTRCQVHFVLTDTRYPSVLESHANFHARTAAGTVTLEWFDQALQLQARFICQSPGLYVTVNAPTGDPVGGGPADLSTYPNCSREVFQTAYFATGLQTLRVTATASACWANDGSRSKCPFHGYLVLDRAVR